MRKILAIFILLFSLNATAQNSFEVKYKYTAILGRCIDYECSNFYSEYDTIIEKPNATDEKKILDFIVKNNERVKTKKTIAYSCISDEFEIPLDETDIDNSQFSIDTVFTIDKKGKEKAKAIKNIKDYSTSSLLRFTEEWYYHKNTNQLNVVVNGYAPVFAVYSELNEYKGLMPMYWNKLHQPVSYSNGARIIADTSISWAQQIRFQMPLTYKEKHASLMNRDVSNIKKLFNMELADILFTEAKNQNIEVYHPQTGKKLDALELNERLTSSDTLFVSDENGEIIPKVVQQTVSRESLGSLIINQSFIFNENDFTITSKINSIIVTGYLDYFGIPKELFEVRFSK